MRADLVNTLLFPIFPFLSPRRHTAAPSTLIVGTRQVTTIHEMLAVRPFTERLPLNAPLFLSFMSGMDQTPAFSARYPSFTSSEPFLRQL